jgi:hypothetical protein
MSKEKRPPRRNLAAPRPVESLIRVVRGQKVMLDADLAALYGVETKQLNRAVKRNLSRFPEEFMFRLTEEERLRCQIGTSNNVISFGSLRTPLGTPFFSAPALMRRSYAVSLK